MPPQLPRQSCRSKDFIMIYDLLKNKLSQATDHTELRAQVNTGCKVTLLSGSLVANTRSSSGGVCARVYKNGSWGFSASADYDEESVKSVLREAHDNAVFLDSHLKKAKPPLQFSNTAQRGSERPFIELPQRLYIDFAKEVDSYIEKKYPDLAGRTVVCTSDSMEKLMYTTEGSFLHSVSPRAYVYIFMTAETKDGSTVELFDAIHGGEGYFTDFFTSPERVFAAADRLYEKLMAKKEGVFPNAGLADVVLDAELSGMLAHEAVGHTTEADLVIGGSVAGHCLGKQVASPMISLVDFAHTAFGKSVPLPLYIDDEGTACRDEWIITDGILTGYMNNCETAARFNMQPSGNARAHTFSDEPIIRMRNTAILPGKDKLEDMIASIDDGYYLTDTGNGQADTTGEFMFGITMGYEIKNGKLGRALRDTTISGVAFEMLKTVSMLSDTCVWNSSGYCGKKQLIPVGVGGPAVKCKVTIGGR